jgi:T-complex protein 1 subunit delta
LAAKKPRRSGARHSVTPLSALQDVVAGDGTTTVTVLCGSLLSRCLGLLEKGVHPTLISEAFQLASDKAVEVLKAMATPVNLHDRDALINSAMTCAATPL